MNDNLVGISSGIVGFIVTNVTGVFGNGFWTFVFVTVAAGFLGYAGKVLCSYLIKGIKKIFEKKQK